MRSVKLNFLLIFFLIFGFSYQGSADCPSLAYSNTQAEIGAKKFLDGFRAIFSIGFAGGFKVDEKLYQYIDVTSIKDQGPAGYFNPKIKVCDWTGKDYCYELSSGTSCRQIYGTQSTGGGVSAAVFIDWEGNTTKDEGGMAQGLNWEWANDVTDEEKEKFANSPKICACSQKGACMSGASAYFARVGQGANIFRPGEMQNVCDTCSWNSRGKQKIKCAPVPLAPGPPPFCAQLEMSPAQVRIVPITHNDNDYFDPKVKVIIGNLKDKNGKIGVELDFPKEYEKENAQENHITDESGTTYYFKTYKERGKLCTEYLGTEESKRKLQFSARCFPAPPAPEPEIIEIVKKGIPGEPSDTLKVKIKMSKDICRAAYGTYSGDSCTFNINNHPTNIGPLSLKVKKPKIVPKTAAKKSGGDMLEKILSNNQQFKILEKYGYVPDILIGCSGSIDDKDFYKLADFNEEKIKKCKLDSLGQPEIEVQYAENSKSRMLCLSGWQLKPEEFALERGGEVISLKSMGASYAKYNTVYSKESNQPSYFPCDNDKPADLLAKLQSELDEMIFNKRGYVSIPEENKNRKNCTVTETNEMDAKQNCNECKIVYELKEHEEKCNQGKDGCICPGGEPSCSTQYVDKKSNQPFYLNEQKEAPMKVNSTEVFYADKLCRFDLESLKKRLHEIIMRQLKDKKQKLENSDRTSYKHSSSNSYTGDLSGYDHVEIEAWGGGEAGHIKGKAHSAENRSGMPGDYIKAKLKIDPNYPIIRTQVTEGGGGQEGNLSNKDGGPTIIEMCNDPSRRDCKPLITVAGGGKYKEYGGRGYKKTVIHRTDLKLEEPTIVPGTALTKDNQIAYIENGEIKYKMVKECNRSHVDQTYGAGGCINESGSGENYSKGSPGYAEIKPILSKIDDKKINAINYTIEKIIDNPSIITSDDSLIKELSKDSLIRQLIDNSLINKLDDKIIKTIKEEIGKELLGK